MRSAQQSTTQAAHASESNVEPQARPGLGRALKGGLDIPLAALRASMESLSKELGRSGTGRTIINGALAEMDRLGRNVRDLVDYAVPPTPLPLNCTLQEIACAARHALDESVRRRLFLAHAGSEASLFVDGPLLSRALQRLVENAFEAGSDRVLLVCRQDEELTTFAVVDEAAQSFDTDWGLSAYCTTKSNHMGLGLALVKRDVEVLGGSLQLRRSTLGGTCAVVTLNTESKGQQS